MSERDRETAEAGRVDAEEKREQVMQGTRKARNAFVYSTIIVLCATFLMAVFTVGTTIYFSQKWCAVIVLFDDTYKDTPPTTEAGKTLAREFKELRKAFFC